MDVVWAIVSLLAITVLVGLWYPRFWLWTIVSVLWLIAWQMHGTISGVGAVLLWIFGVLTWVPMNIRPLRRVLITRGMFAIFKRNLPKMSQTEAEAISAGDTWWEKEVFQGRPNWKHLHELKLSELNDEEKLFLDNETETLCAMLDDWKITHIDKDLSPEVWQYIKDKGFFGMVIAKQYGGKGFSAAAHSAVVMKIGTKSLTAAVTVMVPNSLGPGELIYHYGTKEQKDHYLPRLARGEEVPCFGLTSEAGGSDATAMVDRGIVCRGEFNGQEVLGMRLTFSKRYITLAPVATLIGLAFKLSDPNHLLGDKEELGITLCLLPRNHPGLEIGRRHWPLDIPFMNGPITGENVFVPLDWVIGGKEMIGRGWMMLVECLSIGRSISLPALSSASGAVNFLAASAYAVVRQQFKVPLYKFEGVEEKLAQIGGFAYLLDACRRLTLTAVDQQIKPSVASAIAKYHMTEMGRQVVNNSMDIHGGKGIMLGPHNYLGRAYQATPVSITVEGANILTRNLIIFGQGSIRCHPYILQEMQAVMANDLKEFDQVIYPHFGYILSTICRAAWNGLTAGKLIDRPAGKLSRYYRDVTRISTALAVSSEVIMLTLGGKLKRKERISARLGDALSYLYLASAVLKHFHDHRQSESELPLARWSLQHCLYQAQEALVDTYENLPSRWLRQLNFLWGKPFKKPSDRLDREVVKAMLEQPSNRAWFAQYCHLSSGMMATLQHALDNPTSENIQKVVAVDAFAPNNI